jgi:hypothetical protein
MPSQALGKAPTGKTLSSYRDLCEAATDLGQPQLIYQFLALSSHHRKYVTRKICVFVYDAFYFPFADIHSSVWPKDGRQRSKPHKTRS